MTLEPTNVSLSHFLDQNFTMTAKVREFSNDDIHCPGREGSFTDYSPEFQKLKDVFSLTIHANGINDDNKGWILLLFEPAKIMHYVVQKYYYFEFSFVVSVIDTSGNKRLLRSFSYDLNSLFELKSTFIIEQYIERDTLLAEPLDYLPEDCLTLHMDVCLKAIGQETPQYKVRNKIVDQTFQIDSAPIGGATCFLLLDSNVAQKLKEESDFFRFISEAPMREGITRRMNLCVSEYKFVHRIGKILLGSNLITVKSFDEICEMYLLADKYLVRVAIEICRSLVINFLLFKGNSFIVEGIPRSILLKLAKKYEDLRLKEIVESYSKIEETDVEGKNLTREDIEEETGWKVKLFEYRSFFTFELSKVCRNYKQVPDHDFYR